MTDTPTPDLTAPERMFVQMDYPDQANIAFMEQSKRIGGRVEYTRADIPAARIAELEAENARLRALLDASDAWARGEPSRPPRAALHKGEG